MLEKRFDSLHLTGIFIFVKYLPSCFRDVFFSFCFHIESASTHHILLFVVISIGNYFPSTEHITTTRSLLARAGTRVKGRRSRRGEDNTIKGNGCVALSTENIVHFGTNNRLLRVSLFTICLLCVLSHFSSSADYFLQQSGDRREAIIAGAKRMNFLWKSFS